MQRGVTLSNLVLMTTKNNELLLLNYIFTFTYLADGFIRSGLQMEAIKLYVM